MPASTCPQKAPFLLNPFNNTLHQLSPAAIYLNAMELEGNRTGGPVFHEKGRAVRIWLDPALPSYTELLSAITTNGGYLTSTHASAFILVLHPNPVLFDLYCHPEWRSEKERCRRKLAGTEAWEGKVIVTAQWPKLCAAAGMMLGESYNWGGCRKGGPPASNLSPSTSTVTTYAGLTSSTASASRLIAPLPKSSLGATRSPVPQPHSSVGRQHAGPSTHAPSYSPSVEPSPPVRARKVRRLAVSLSPEPLPSNVAYKSGALEEKAVKAAQLSPSSNSTASSSAAIIPLVKSESATPVPRLTLTVKATVSKPSSTAKTVRSPPNPPKFSMEQLDEIIRNAHLISLREGKCVKDVVQLLSSTYQEHVPDTWRRHYLQWVACTGRFAPLLMESGYLGHVDLFLQYLPLVRSGSSLATIADQLAEYHPKHRLSSAEWSVQLGNWLRTVGPDTAPPALVSPTPSPPAVLLTTPSPSIPSRQLIRPLGKAEVVIETLEKRSAPRTPSHPVVSSSTPRVSGRSREGHQSKAERSAETHEKRMVLARMFKESYGETGVLSRVVGEQLALKSAWSASSLAVWCGQWLNRSKRFSGIPHELQPSVPPRL